MDGSYFYHGNDQYDCNCRKCDPIPQYHPPCFVCGKESTLVCVSNQCEYPPFYCEQNCFNSLGWKMHRHSQFQTNTFAWVDNRIKDIQDKDSTDINYKYFQDLRTRFSNLKQLFNEALYSHSFKINHGFALKPNPDCKDFYQRTVRKSFQYSKGKEVGIFMSENGIQYQNQQVANRIIQKEKRLMEKILSTAQIGVKQYLELKPFRQYNEKGEDMLEKAKDSIKEQKWEEAIEKGEQASSLLVQNYEVYDLLGDCYKQIHKYQQSKLSYLKCIDINPQHTKALCDAGELSTALKQYQQSIVCYNQLIKLNNNNAEYYVARGKNHQNLKNYPKAFHDFTTACKIETGNEMYNFYKRQAMYLIAFAQDSDKDQ